MTLSIRNQFPGTVVEIRSGEVMATVTVRLDGGQIITAAITREAVEQLGLAPGSAVRALVKSTEVAVATNRIKGLSIRNQLPGAITHIALGGAMASVRMAMAGGEITAVITKDAATELGLFVGSDAVALIKSTEVALATD
ncbi:molybdopterin-binding protein [Streptomyces sp. NPDC086787]|uniref:TOBE domain-containing protein n=1 Tax=Streptomyces sp. NPDC086787 TaxID=3365759 RepID=UPI00380E5BE9